MNSVENWTFLTLKINDIKKLVRQTPNLKHGAKKLKFCWKSTLVLLRGIEYTPWTVTKARKVRSNRYCWQTVTFQSYAGAGNLNKVFAGNCKKCKSISFLSIFISNPEPILPGLEKVCSQCYHFVIWSIITLRALPSWLVCRFSMTGLL